MATSKVYLNRLQCDKFDIQYFSDDEFYTEADILLNSRGPGGYDRDHTDLLSPLMSQRIFLRRVERDPPGWYQIIHENFQC